ncbi:MAG TPA: hypothetical protein VEO01_04810, partial [Pseudonocardiaceae bacterium]|nr:hypothetical protein [Pseudonocardiaceae bacterium]
RRQRPYRRRHNNRGRRRNSRRTRQRSGGGRTGTLRQATDRAAATHRLADQQAAARTPIRCRPARPGEQDHQQQRDAAGQ